MEIIKRLRAPVRIDFGGGTTDISPFKDKYGGAVLNAAINKYVTGRIIKTDESIHLEYTGKTPTSSGLGTSSSMNVVWLALISQIKMKRKGGVNYKDKLELAEKAYKLEQALELVGGKQDQYAAAFGGINFLEFKKDKTLVHPLNLDKQFLKKFEDKLVLVYTGKPHFSGNTNKSAIDNLLKGKNIKNLLAIKKIAFEMKDALIEEDLERFAELMNQETEYREGLHGSIVPMHIRKMIRSGKNNGAIGAKVCGSGGGGSILFLGDKEKLKKKFGEKVIDFKFDFQGLTWV